MARRRFDRNESADRAVRRRDCPAEPGQGELLRSERREWVDTDLLVTGDGSSAPPRWTPVHPEHATPQIAMADAWFDHTVARCPPLPDADYELRSGRTASTIIGLDMSGPQYKDDAERLPALWRRGRSRRS